MTILGMLVRIRLYTSHNVSFGAEARSYKVTTLVLETCRGSLRCTFEAYGEVSTWLCTLAQRYFQKG